MDYRDNVRRALKYMEDRLADGIDFEAVAAEACYSPYHFSRVFALVVGESPGAYLRRRRLAKAAARLAGSGDRVLDIALDSGFGSQEAFTRAFKDEFGTAPGAYRRAAERRPGRESALHDGVFLQGGTLMKHRIERMPARLVAGFPCYGAPGPDGVFNEVWDLFNEKLADHSWHRNQPGIGIEFYAGDCTDMAKWFYLAGSFAESVEAVPHNLAIKPVPASDWFVATHSGSLATLTATYREAYAVAIPSLDLEPWLPIDFELYDSRFKGVNDPATEIEIWIPVRKKP